MLHIINSNVQNLKIDGMIKDDIFCEFVYMLSNTQYLF